MDDKSKCVKKACMDLDARVRGNTLLLSMFAVRCIYSLNIYSPPCHSEAALWPKNPYRCPCTLVWRRSGLRNVDGRVEEPCNVLGRRYNPSRATPRANLLRLP